MTRFLGASKPETRNIYNLRFINRAMPIPSGRDFQSLDQAKKIALKLHKRGYRGEILKVRQAKDSIGWFIDVQKTDLGAKVVWTF